MSDASSHDLSPVRRVSAAELSERNLLQPEVRQPLSEVLQDAESVRRQCMANAHMHLSTASLELSEGLGWLSITEGRSIKYQEMEDKLTSLVEHVTELRKAYVHTSKV